MVPKGRGVAFVVDSSGAFVVGVNPHDSVWLQRAMAPINVLEVFGRRDGDLNLVSRSHDLVFGDWNTFCTRRASSVAGMYLYTGFSLDFGLVDGVSRR